MLCFCFAHCCCCFCCCCCCYCFFFFTFLIFQIIMLPLINCDGISIQQRFCSFCFNVLFLVFVYDSKKNSENKLARYSTPNSNLSCTGLGEDIWGLSKRASYVGEGVAFHHRSNRTNTNKPKSQTLA